MADQDDDNMALEAWLRDRLGVDAVQLGEVRRPQGSGFSAETLIFTATIDRAGTKTDERLVVRKETAEPPIYPQQAPGLDVEIAIQFRIMDTLSRHSAVPVAPLVGYEPDARVLGVPFFAMQFVDGQVPIENPLYTRSGFFVDASPDSRRAMIDDGLRVLAAVHAVDWRAAGLDWLVPPGVKPSVRTQIELWQRCADHELHGRRHPLLDDAFAWLHANLAEPEEVCLNWGDARPGNMIWRDFRCVCATDFEAACIAPPQVDLGWWLMFDRWVHETMSVERLPGEPTREQQRDRYVALTGRDVGDTTFYEVFAAARYSAIVVRVMNRSVDRGLAPPDQMFWLRNPAATCLEDLLTTV
ncbi:MAG TPA: phosphotransferase family protein [Acidimicrobiales bacterium]|jgi:aminoglycoside phosphotransferase (APT) family kinase protein|nr:phosphotransferase family protein [Acidimicrobiales bacterium]